MKNPAPYKKALEERRRSLLELGETSKDTTRPVELDQTMVGRLSRMDAMQQQQMALANARRRTEELQRIEVALKRIENGDYGYCLKCDEEIAGKRLDFDPATLVCIECAGGIARKS